MRLLLLGALAATLAGCAGDGVDPASGATPTPGGVVRIDQIEDRIFVNNCLTSGCHNTGDAAGGLILEPGLAFANLVGVDSVNPAAASAGLLRVRAFQPDDSFLLTKVTAPGAGQGALMPIGQPRLTQAEIDLLRQWIADGALDAAGATPMASATPTPPATASATPTLTATPLPSDTPTETPTGTLAPSATATQTATPTSTPTEVVVSLSSLQASIFTPKCASRFCHDAAAVAQLGDLDGNLDLTAGASYGQLVGVLSDNAAAATAGVSRVVPGDPRASFLMQKVCYPTAGVSHCATMPLAQEFGSRMPPVGAMLSPADLEAIAAWIARGAPDD